MAAHLAASLRGINNGRGAANKRTLIGRINRGAERIRRLGVVAVTQHAAACQPHAPKKLLVDTGS